MTLPNIYILGKKFFKDIHLRKSRNKPKYIKITSKQLTSTISRFSRFFFGKWWIFKVFKVAQSDFKVFKVRHKPCIIQKFFSGKCGDALNSAIYFINKVDIYMKIYIRYLHSDKFFRYPCDGRTKGLDVSHIRTSLNFTEPQA